jgi:hypothetical protein
MASAASSSCRLASVFGCSREQDSRSGILLLRNEKGRVVRGPFSTLQAWLIAVSPQPGVALAIGSRTHSLEHRGLPRHGGYGRRTWACRGERPKAPRLYRVESKRETERGSRQAPALPSPASSSGEELLLHPSVISDEAAAASLPF